MALMTCLVVVRRDDDGVICEARRCWYATDSGASSATPDWAWNGWVVWGRFQEDREDIDYGK